MKDSSIDAPHERPRRRRGRPRRAPILLAWLILVLQPAAAAGLVQRAVDPDHGVLAVARGLKGLGQVKRVLVIGAHPDDEDTELLTVLERGMGAEAAYLSLTRGEGGQNLIGPELGVGLGLIRTQELLAARRIDGAEQFFTRAFDFGYSKSAEETFDRWPRDSLLADVVGVVREFRPQVIVSIFSGTSRDGHGQHQVAGMLAREAFVVAGDPDRFPDQVSAGLRPWQPLKLYRSTRFDRDETTLAIETGRLDPLHGRSYHQIAMAGRSQHRSQDMGRIEGLGPAKTRVRRLKSRVTSGPAESERSLFDGVDTTLVGLLTTVDDPTLRAELTAKLNAYATHLEDARRGLTAWGSEAAAPHLALALGVLRRALEWIRAVDGGTDLRFFLREEEERLADALAAASGLIVGGFADDDLLVPGESFQVEVEIWNGGTHDLGVGSVALQTPGGWRVEPLDSAGPITTGVAAGTLATRRFRVTVSQDAAVDQPYFLRSPRRGAMYVWPPDPAVRARPFGPPPVTARISVEVRDQRLDRIVEVVHRFADQARGEVRRPLDVVPAVGVSLEPETTVWRLDRESARPFSVGLRSESPKPVTGRVRLIVPAGWRVEPASARFRLDAPGSAQAFDFSVRAPDDLLRGEYRLEAVAENEDGRVWRTGYAIIDYPHIRPQVLLEEADTRVEAFPLRVAPGLRVGYVPGAGDAVPEAVRSMGTSLEVLDGMAVSTSDLSGYDVIVVGIRAYETNEALVENNARLLDWVRAGGTLIVQYQQYRFFRGDFAPYPLKARYPHDRVTDENAPVQVLAPDHPVFVRPNRIGPADFRGWVQERGLYFPHEWDERYRPLLAMADPGEEPKRGALLVAESGRGTYVYTGLALFRQLPAGVPGAYRLLANLLSLGR